MIDYFVLLGLIFDLWLTWQFLDIYRERFPKKDYTAVETNPLIRFCVRKFGLNGGMIISGFVIMIILIWLLTVLPYQWKYFMMGVYYMMVAFHLLNLLAVKRLGEVKQ